MHEATQGIYFVRTEASLHRVFLPSVHMQQQNCGAVRWLLLSFKVSTFAVISFQETFSSFCSHRRR